MHVFSRALYFVEYTVYFTGCQFVRHYPHVAANRLKCTLLTVAFVLENEYDDDNDCRHKKKKLWTSRK